MIRVKICGVTTARDLQAVVDAGADAVGFNFHRASKRWIDPSVAAPLARTLPAFVTRVGVFVDESRESIESIAAQVGLDVIQLHGAEPPELARSLSRRVIRAVRARDERDLEGVEEYGASAVLVDAFVPGQAGGTGVRGDWNLARAAARRFPLILAGGLDCENVADAVRQVQPYAVDVASGVEAAPGRKDPRKVRTFVERAHHAFAAIEARS
ncbi:MAG: phosphoribosylanthranilate isomerase [bacterium]